MGLTLAVTNKHKVGTVVLVQGTITFTGNYASGDEDLNLPESGLVPGLSQDPLSVLFGYVGKYLVQYNRATDSIVCLGQDPTDATAGVIALSEIADAAYPAGLLDETVPFTAICEIP